MKEIKASIWDREFDSFWRVIPINTTLKTNGSLVMGAGLAKQAAERYVFLPAKLGNYYKSNPASLLYSYEDLNFKFVAFPTKIHWKQMSDLKLIEKGLIQLRTWIAQLQLEAVPYKIASPRLGCGSGGLNWERDVKPLVEKYFGDDDNFVVVSL